MQKLRLLQVNNIHLGESFEGLFEELQRGGAHWKVYPLTLIWKNLRSLTRWTIVVYIDDVYFLRGLKSEI